MAEGHSALVFSQFTRFLGILRSHLDAVGVTYSYLDGSLSAREREQLKDFFDRFLRRRTRGKLTVEAPVFLEKLKGVPELLAAREAKGEAKGQRKTILAFLRARLGPVPRALVTALEATTDTRRLEAATRAASAATSFAEVQRALRPRRRATRPAQA